MHFSFLPCVLHVPTIFGEACTLWSSSLCSLLHPPTTSSPLGPNILLSALFSKTLNKCSSLSVRETKFHTHTKQQQNYNSIYFNL
jgi:hypothetical protein